MAFCLISYLLTCNTASSKFVVFCIDENSVLLFSNTCFPSILFSLNPNSFATVALDAIFSFLIFSTGMTRGRITDSAEFNLFNFVIEN